MHFMAFRCEVARWVSVAASVGGVCHMWEGRYVGCYMGLHGGWKRWPRWEFGFEVGGLHD